MSGRVDEPAVPRPLTPRPSPALGLSADELADVMVARMIASHARGPTAEQVEEAHGRTYLTFRFLMEEYYVALGLVTEAELDAGERISFAPDLMQGCVAHMDEETWERLAFYQQAPHRAPDTNKSARVPERVDLEGFDREKALGVDPDEGTVDLEMPEGRRATKAPSTGRFLVRSY